MAIHIPQGGQEFMEAVQRLRNSDSSMSREEREALATKCCTLCTARKFHDECDECYVGKAGELADSYKAKANSSSSSGMYGSGICIGPDGKYRYTHNGGG